jgi:hypothetical protein
MPPSAARSMRIKRHSETPIQPRVCLCQETKTIKLVIFDLEKHEKIVEIPIVDCHEGDARKMKLQKLIECGEVQRKRGTKTAHKFQQNWQWSCIDESGLKIQIVEFLVTWSERDPRRSTAEIVGMKLVLLCDKLSQ